MTGRWPSRDPIHENNISQFNNLQENKDLEHEIIALLDELGLLSTSARIAVFDYSGTMGLLDLNFYAFSANDGIGLVDRLGLEPIGGSGSNYRPDPFGHGTHPNGAPIDPHVDKIDPNGNKVRYNPDGSPRGGAPKVPKKDLSAFKKALEKLKQICDKCPKPPKPPGGMKLGGGMMMGPDEMDSIIRALKDNFEWAKNLETFDEMQAKCKSTKK